MNRHIIFKLFMLSHHVKSNFYNLLLSKLFTSFQGDNKIQQSKNILQVFVIIMNNELVFYILW